jgi:diguanylate cyclase (GGDEF)-like protein
MRGEARVYSLPRWRLTRWLADAGPDVPADLRVALIGGLYGSLPVYFGGVINTLLVSGTIAARIATAPFIAWFAFELIVCISRFTVLTISRHAALKRRATATDIYLVLSLAWSGGIGYGVLISMASGDWVSATLACLSAAAMVGGICFRNFSAPRLAGAMILTSLGPAVPGALIAGQPLLFVVFLQIPMYTIAMMAAAFKLNKMLIATMNAERENDYKARHDMLTGLSNRAGLEYAIARRGKNLALFFLDFDDFKTVNDTYGHAAGDDLLKMTAERLGRTLRARDIAARIGGDEFVVIAEDLTHDQAAEMGQRFVAAVTSSYDLGRGAPVRVGVSVGIAMAPEHGTDLADLLAVADAALYEAKSAGKSRCCMASPDINLSALRRMHDLGKGRGVKPIGAVA